MKSVFATLALIGAAFAQTALSINTPPSLTECVPAAVTYVGGTPPYFVAVIPGGQTAAAPILQFAETSATSITWIVNITTGTNVTFKITDSTGVSAFSGPDVIQPGTTDSCLSGTTGSSSSSSSSSTASTSSGTTTTSASTSSSTTTTTTVAPTTTATTSSRTSGTTTTTTSSPSTTPSTVGGSTSGAGMVTAPLAIVLGLFAFLA